MAYDEDFDLDEECQRSVAAKAGGGTSADVTAAQVLHPPTHAAVATGESVIQTRVGTSMWCMDDHLWKMMRGVGMAAPPMAGHGW
jgi:hypothetical protein